MNDESLENKDQVKEPLFEYVDPKLKYSIENETNNKPIHVPSAHDKISNIPPEWALFSGKERGGIQ